MFKHKKQYRLRLVARKWQKYILFFFTLVYGKLAKLSHTIIKVVFDLSCIWFKVRGEKSRYFGNLFWYIINHDYRVWWCSWGITYILFILYHDISYLTFFLQKILFNVKSSKLFVFIYTVLIVKSTALWQQK